MTQNLISLDLSADDVAEFDAALAVIEKFVTPFVSLTGEEVKALSKMGEKSEQFCRQTLMVLAQNREVLPASFDLDEMEADLAAHATLAPRALRLREVLSRFEDTQMALGSDIMVAASDGYALMKMFGKAEGLSALQESMAALRPGRRASKPKAG